MPNYYFFLQLRVFHKQANISKKQNEISEEQNKIIKNQLLIGSRREHSVEIKANVIPYLQEKIQKMPYFEIETPQFDNNAKSGWVIKIEDKFSLTEDNFFEKVKLPMSFSLESGLSINATGMDNGKNKNNLYADFLKNHLGKDKDFFMQNFNSFLEYSNKYHDMIVDVQQKFKNEIESKCKDIDEKTIESSFDPQHDLLLIIYRSWVKGLETDGVLNFIIERTKDSSNYKAKYVDISKFSIIEKHVDKHVDTYLAGGSEKDLKKLLDVSMGLLKYSQTDDFKKIKSDLDDNKNKIEELKSHIVGILSEICKRPILEGLCNFLEE